jgi:hypothetical protein
MDLCLEDSESNSQLDMCVDFSDHRFKPSLLLKIRVW